MMKEEDDEGSRKRWKRYIASEQHANKAWTASMERSSTERSSMEKSSMEKRCTARAAGRQACGLGRNRGSPQVTAVQARQYRTRQRRKGERYNSGKEVLPDLVFFCNYSAIVVMLFRLPLFKVTGGVLSRFQA